ncbi:DUF2341 domain-containing protein [Aurantibacillus circumpalustris]|uniref:DUF2341 domain-containing protein n=1 Tax=Aurantibacillus circumpalustris TaxID=3036359 RepID=UPI00295A8447|nr:DUF2341 domain-containing protein [Aurantibacillus circumpalustris]
MKTKYFLFFSILFIAVSDFTAQATCSYKYRKRITFNSSQVSGTTDLIDFPVIISITNDNNLRVTSSGGHVQSANGYDIIFTSSDGVTVLNHELTSYTSTNGSLDCWVKIPLLSVSIDTDIYMYYGNSAVTTDQSTTNTWSNGFVGVWHFDNDVNNSTALTWMNGTNYSTSNNATAKFGTARRFQSGSSQYIDVSPYNSAYNLFSDLTVSAWLRPSTIGIDQKIAGNEDNVNGGWKFGVYTDNKIEFEIRNSSNSPSLSRSASGGTPITNNTWHYIVGQYSDPGDFINTYLNGSLDRNYSTTASCWSSPGTMKIGREPFASTAFLDGRLDELRLSNVIRSAGWIATEYNNQNSPGPGTFYTISSEPKEWLGGSSTVWSTGGNWSGGSAPAASTDIIISSGTFDPILNANLQLNSVMIRSGATLSLSNRTLSIASDVMNCGVINGSTGNLVLNSTSSNIQVQNLSGSGTYNLNNLTINNTFSSPSVVLNNSVGVAGSLVLTSGIVYTSATNILALGTSATSSSGSSSSFVSGPMSKVGTTDFIFPIGKNNKWRRASVTSISASSTFRAEYFDTPYANSTTVNAPLNNVSKMEYWQVDRIVGAGNAKLALYWEDASASVINNCPDLTIARWNGASWDERAGTTVGGSSCSGTGSGNVLSNAVITAFSPFTFASKLGGVNPLPVELSNFSASCGDEGVEIKWTTQSESNNDFFKLQKSKDGLEWQNVKNIVGAGNSRSEKEYTFLDKVYSNEISYYSISQVDFDGTEKRYKLISVACGKKKDGKVTLFPNPVITELNFDLNSLAYNGECQIKIVDNLGRLCQEFEFYLNPENSAIKMPINLKSGYYFVQIFSGKTLVCSNRVIVQAEH